MKPELFLYTPRLVLRPLVPEDAPSLLALRSDPEVNKYIDRPPTESVNEALAFISKINDSVNRGESFYWAISFINEPRLIGTVCLWNFVRKEARAEIGYELETTEQGKGIMQEALTRVLSFCFKELNLETITALPQSGNRRSIRLLEKNNFTLDESGKYDTGPDMDKYITYYISKRGQDD